MAACQRGGLITEVSGLNRKRRALIPIVGYIPANPSASHKRLYVPFMPFVVRFSSTEEDGYARG